MIERFHSLAARDRFGVHALVPDAESADIILFVDLHQFHLDWQLKQLRRHPLVQRFGTKIMVYDERDRPFCIFPGLYVSMPKTYFDVSRQRACSYSYLKNELVQPVASEPDLLFSFQGASTHSSRRTIFTLSHPRAVIENTSAVNFFEGPEMAANEEYQTRVRLQKERYKEIVARSKFVLCPRGWGVSSFRLFETLAAGRVPVIVSDEWVAPRGPDWDACSVRIQESDVLNLARILEAREAQWPVMAQNAADTFRAWFAADVLFHRMMDDCQDLLQHAPLGPRSLSVIGGGYRASGWLSCFEERTRGQLSARRHELKEKLKRRSSGSAQAN